MKKHLKKQKTQRKHPTVENKENHISPDVILNFLNLWKPDVDSYKIEVLEMHYNTTRQR